MVLWVSDEGPGIESKTMEHIFEAFRRGEIHGQRGVGLGLAIASHAAKLLGAKLTAKSELGSGTTFYVHFLGGPVTQTSAGTPLPLSFKGLEQAIIGGHTDELHNEDVWPRSYKACPPRMTLW
jgi:hypothetical protein